MIYMVSKCQYAYSFKLSMTWAIFNTRYFVYFQVFEIVAREAFELKKRTLGRQRKTDVQFNKELIFNRPGVAGAVL